MKGIEREREKTQPPLIRSEVPTQGDLTKNMQGHLAKS